MKRLFSLLACCLLLFSCEKETMLTVDQTSLSFTDAGGSSSITLTANKPWSASSNQSWCKVSPSAGEEATGSRVSITCDANTTYDARNATITITCAELTKQISISQATNNGLLVSQTSYEVTKAAQQLSIQVQANVKFSVEVDNGCKDWVKYNSTKALSTSTVVLDIAENNTYDSREGKVTIRQDGGNLSSTVTIKQSQLDGLFITTPEYNLSNEKHTLTVEVSTNVEFDVKPEADWVKYVQTKGLNTKQIVLQVEENDTYDQRETKVNVKQKNGDLSGVITIKQDEKYGILVTQPEYSLSNEAATIDVEVKYNVDFDVVIPDECKEWIKQVSTKSLDSKTYTFSVAKNETYDNREGSITFKQKKGSLSGTVTIKQAQTDCIIPEKSEYVVSYEEQQLNIRVASNIEYEVDIDEGCRSWLSRVQTKGLTEESLTFQVAKNEGEERIGKITFKGSTIQETVLIRQNVEGYVEFEDANFKAYCVANFDEDGDGEISIAEAKKVITIDVNTESIASLKGIEYFTNLQNLKCEPDWDGWSSHSGGGRNYNKNGVVVIGLLTALDLSQNTELRYLHCEANQITSLDLTYNTVLTSLSCAANRLSSLDISKCTALSTIDCSCNAIRSLELTKCPALRWLSCSSNRLTSLDVTKCPALDYLECGSNPLTSLDITKCVALTYLSCNSNQLASLDVTKCPALTYLSCGDNQLTSLDVSKCAALTYLFCGGNHLTMLDVTRCPELDYLSCHSNQLTTLDVTKCAKLLTLSCEANRLTSLNVTKCPALTSLSCGGNRLTSLDITKCVALTYLSCNSNQLASLDVTKCPALTFLSCGGNQLTSLDVSKCLALDYLECYSNPMSFLFLSTGQYIPNLSKDESTIIEYPGNVPFEDAKFKAYCVANFDRDGDGEISKEEARAVTTINVDTRTISSLKGIEYFTSIQNLTCRPNWNNDGEDSFGLLKSLDLSSNGMILYLYCDGNQLTSLNISNCVALSVLDCRNNHLSALDVYNCKNLTKLLCSSNQLSSLDLSNNLSLTSLECEYNQITTLDLKNSPALKQIRCAFNQLISLDVSSCTEITDVFCNNNPMKILYLPKNHTIENQDIPAGTEIVYREGRSGNTEGIGYDVWE